MKPAQKRDISTLRRQILAEIAQHPLTLFPAGFAALAGVWATAFKPSAPAIIATAAGISLSVIAAVYNLMFNGANIRDRILGKWEKEADAEENLTKQELRNQLLSTPGTDDILRLYERLEGVNEELRTALASETISDVNRAHFLPIAEQNYENGITLINRLAYNQVRLSNLLHSAKRERAEETSKLVRVLREQRSKMISHVRQIITGMEKVTVEVPMLAECEVEKSQRDLIELERSLEIARTAYQRLRDETRPISRPDNVQVGDVSSPAGGNGQRDLE